MGKFVAGDVIVINFPFSDFSAQKRRPALVLAQAEFGNLILCQITSKPYSSQTSIKIENDNFKKGGLPVVSYARPDKIFTVEPSIIQKKAGSLKKTSLNKVLSKVRAQFIEQ